MWISDRLFAPAAAVLRPDPVRLEQPAWTGPRRSPHPVLWSASLHGWGLRPAVRARLPEPLASILTWRRHGTVSATDLP